MAVADVFDALTHARVYKLRFAPDEVDRILREGRGVHFDPVLIDAYFEIRDEFYAIAERLADSA